MKCQKCNKEFDKKQYCLCPQCFSQPTQKERVWHRIWGILFQLSSISITVLTIYGMIIVFGKYSSILTLALGIIYALSLRKRNEHKTEYLEVRVKKFLDEPEFDSICALKKHEIIKVIKEEKSKQIFR